MSSSSVKSPSQARAPATASSNGSGIKRKARASTEGLENGDDTIMTLNGADDHPSSVRDSKRVRRGGTPGAGASRAKPTGWVAKTGMNPLPLPVPHLNKAIFDAGLAPAATSALSPNPSANVAGLSSGPALPREMFVFGNGDMGQHGLGTEALDEIKRPRRHAWVAKACDDGKLGKGGLEMVAAGGMHSLAIDSTGRVRTISPISYVK